MHYFRVFGSKCFILNKKSESSKFAPKVDEGFMLGYGTNEHGYHVFNKTTGLIEIAIDVTFDKTDGSQKEQVNVEIVGNEGAPHKAIKKLAIGEVKPVKVQDEDEDTIAHVCWRSLLIKSDRQLKSKMEEINKLMTHMHILLT